MSIEQTTFAISILSLTVAIAAFAFYGNKNAILRYGLGVLFFFLAVAFALVGVFSLIGGRAQVDTSNTGIYDTADSPQVTDSSQLSEVGETLSSPPNIRSHETIQGSGTRRLLLAEGEAIIGTADKFQDVLDQGYFCISPQKGIFQKNIH